MKITMNSLIAATKNLPKIGHENTPTENEVFEWAEMNDMIALAGDLFEDAGGHVIHESEVITMIMDEKKQK